MVEKEAADSNAEGATIDNIQTKRKRAADAAKSATPAKKTKPAPTKNVGGSAVTLLLDEDAPVVNLAKSRRNLIRYGPSIIVKVC